MELEKLKQEYQKKYDAKYKILSQCCNFKNTNDIIRFDRELQKLNVQICIKQFYEKYFGGKK